jgi:hypothetical protein
VHCTCPLLAQSRHGLLHRTCLLLGVKQTSREPLRLEIDVMHHAGVMHLALALTLGNLLAQIRQPNIGTVVLNQSLFSILARAPALGAGQAHQFGGVITSHLSHCPR